MSILMFAVFDVVGASDWVDVVGNAGGCSSIGLLAGVNPVLAGCALLVELDVCVDGGDRSTPVIMEFRPEGH